MADEERKGLFKGVLGQIESFFKLQFQLFWRDFSFFAVPIANSFVHSFVSIIRKDEREPFQKLADDLVDAGILEAGDVDKIRDIYEPMGALQTPAVLLNLIGVWFKALNIKTDILSSDYIQKLNSTFEPALPAVNDIIRAGFIAPEKNARIRDIAHRYGLKDEDIDLLYLSNYAAYPPEQIKILSLRGILTPTQTYEAMRELGFIDSRTKKIIESWQVIPGPQDIFWMVGKEAFEEDAVSLMGLDDEFPKGQMEWLKKQGISEKWAEKYWRAHWDQPSIGQGFEMLQRGVIEWDELDMLFRTVEIPPYWRKKLTQIAYNPIGRVDLRRINKAQVIKDEKLAAYYEKMGYSPENALIMAEWTVAYNADEDKQLAKGQIIDAYDKRAINRDDAAELLAALGYGEAQVEFMLTMADYQENIDLQTEMIANIKDRFLENLIDKNSAELQLNKLNLSGQRVSVLLSRWETLAYKDRKMPSKTDLDKFYKAGIINADTYMIEMDRLGYSFRLAEMYVRLSKMQKGK